MVGRFAPRARLAGMKDSLHRSTALPHTPAVHDLGGVAHLATTALVCMALAAALGVVASAHLRRRQFSWTWGLVVFAPLPAFVVAAKLGVLDPPAMVILLAIATGAAAGVLGWGLRLRLEDHRAGGDREAAVAQHRGLLDALAPAPRRARRAGRASAGRGPAGRPHQARRAGDGRPRQRQLGAATY